MNRHALFPCLLALLIGSGVFAWAQPGIVYMQTLGSEVGNYLKGLQIPAERISSLGFGKTVPVGDNNTAAGRQRNRRVEIIVSGEVIGATITEAVKK